VQPPKEHRRRFKTPDNFERTLLIRKQNHLNYWSKHTSLVTNSWFGIQ